MKTCPFCGEENRDQNTVCVRCGSVMSEKALAEGKAREEAAAAKASKAPAPRPNGGLIVWSVLTLLFFCLVPGLAGLAYAVNLNCADTKKEQDRRANLAFIFCIVGTMIGTFVIMFSLAAEDAQQDWWIFPVIHCLLRLITTA